MDLTVSQIGSLIKGAGSIVELVVMGNGKSKTPSTTPRNAPSTPSAVSETSTPKSANRSSMQNGIKLAMSGFKNAFRGPPPLRSASNETQPPIPSSPYSAISVTPSKSEPLGGSGADAEDSGSGSGSADGDGAGPSTPAAVSNTDAFRQAARASAQVAQNKLSKMKSAWRRLSSSSTSSSPGGGTAPKAVLSGDWESAKLHDPNAPQLSELLDTREPPSPVPTVMSELEGMISGVYN